MLSLQVEVVGQAVDVRHDDLAAEAADVPVVLQPGEHAGDRFAGGADLEGELGMPRDPAQAQATTWLRFARIAGKAMQRAGQAGPRAGSRHSPEHLFPFAHPY